MNRTSVTAAPLRRLSAGFALQVSAIVIFGSWFGDALAQKLVDPNSVAPEYRAVAEKRRAEQIKLFECSKKADVAKVLRRDRAAFISECLDK
jgi:hypothetical protein